jgi:hypothetical protein
MKRMETRMEEGETKGRWKGSKKEAETKGRCKGSKK